MIAFLRILVRVIFAIFYRVKVVGYDRVPVSGSALLCANHISELDMFFIGYRIKRLVHWMAKEELFKNPLLRTIITGLGAFPVKRGTGDISAIKTSLQLLKKGHIVGIFPEGHRRSKKGTIKVHAGSGLLAVRSQAPVIPVSIEGSGKIFSKVRIVFGTPFTLDLKEDKKYSNDDFLDMSKMIMEKINSQMEA